MESPRRCSRTLRRSGHCCAASRWAAVRSDAEDHPSGGSVAARSGDQQAGAELCRLEIDEVAVALGPPTGCEVIAEAAHRPPLDVRPESRPHRYPATDMLVEVRLGPPPVGL